jgi:predicted GNAT family acetyltransferase
MYENLPLTNDTHAHNFEMIVDGHRAFIDYQLKHDKVFLIHTEVPVELEGHGVAATMVDRTLRYIEEHGWKIVPYCTYIKSYLKKHPEWERLLVA